MRSCGGHNAAEKVLPSTPPIHDGSVDDKAFSRPKHDTKGSPDSRDYPRCPPKKGKTERRRDARLEGLVFQRDLLNARAGVEWPRTECFSRIVE